MFFRKKNKKATDHLNLFVHIPKTAGTSFRNGIESISNVACDYGPESRATSSIVQKELYLKKDNYRLLQGILSNGYNWLSGHFTINKHLGIVDIRNIVSFVREPVDRICSMYSHHKNHLGYKDDFDKFIKIKKYNNGQSKQLDGVPLELIGFLGITEKYNESIGLINNQLDLNIPILVNNVNKDSNYQKSFLNESIKRKISRFNSIEIEQYNKSVWLHNERIKYMNKNLPWVHGTVNLNKKNVIVGLAWYANSNEPVVLQVYVNNEVYDEVIANKYYKRGLNASFPRLGYVLYQSHETKNLPKGSSISVKVKSTGQVLNSKKIII